MDINQNYREAVKSIKEAILRSQYRAAASVNKEQLSLYYGIGRYVSENSRTGFWGKGAIEHLTDYTAAQAQKAWEWAEQTALELVDMKNAANMDFWRSKL